MRSEKFEADLGAVQFFRGSRMQSQAQEVMKELKARPTGVPFHHFLEMTTESRWRFFNILFSVTTTKNV